MNLKLVAGSLSLKKKEKAAQQTARVSFVVSENGEVTDVMVTNMKDLHPALAEEAIRLVQKARWSPAVLLNEKLSLTLVQPIVFRAEAE
jgi:TonB family protein